MRVTGFILIVTFGVANLLVKKRLPPKDVKGGLFNFRIFLNVAFTLFGIACIVGFLGIYTGACYTPISARPAFLARLTPKPACTLVSAHVFRRRGHRSRHRP